MWSAYYDCSPNGKTIEPDKSIEKKKIGQSKKTLKNVLIRLMRETRVFFKHKFLV